MFSDIPPTTSFPLCSPTFLQLRLSIYVLRHSSNYVFPFMLLDISSTTSFPLCSPTFLQLRLPFMFPDISSTTSFPLCSPTFLQLRLSLYVLRHSSNYVFPFMFPDISSTTPSLYVLRHFFIYVFPFMFSDISSTTPFPLCSPTFLQLRLSLYILRHSTKYPKPSHLNVLPTMPAYKTLCTFTLCHSSLCLPHVTKQYCPLCVLNRHVIRISTAT